MLISSLYTHMSYSRNTNKQSGKSLCLKLLKQTNLEFQTALQSEYQDSQTVGAKEKPRWGSW